MKKDIEEIEFEIEIGKIKSEKHKKVINFVKDNEGVTIPEIEMFTDCSRAIVNTLIKNGYLEVIEQKVDRNPLINKKTKKTENLELNSEQKEAFNKVEKCMKEKIYKSFLLFGITGSGKTEVYLQLIKRALEEGKTAIVLVPEISLTPQMLDRFIRKIWKRRNSNFA